MIRKVIRVPANCQIFRPLRAWRPFVGYLFLFIAYLVVGTVTLIFAEDLSEKPGGACQVPQDCLNDAVRALNGREADQAIARLNELLAKFPDTPWEGRAALLLGKYYQTVGDRQASSLLMRAERQLPLLGDYAQYFLGEFFFQAGDVNGGATAFDVLVDRYPGSVLRPQALYRSVETWFQGDDCMRSRERQGRFLAEYPKNPLVPAVLLRQGDCLLKDGDAALAAVVYRRAWSQYAATPQGDEAAARMQRMRQNGITVPDPTAPEWWLRGRTLFDAGQHARAITAFDELLKFQDVPDRLQARLNVGIARVRLKQYDEAQQVFSHLAKSRSGQISFEAVVWLARIYLRQGKDDLLLSLAREVDAGLLSGDLKARFLVLLAAQHADRGRLDKAVATYLQAGDLGMTATTTEAYWQAGWLQYTMGRYEDAVTAFDRTLHLINVGGLGLAALYWRARILEKLGETAQAATAYQTLCADVPNSYYCSSARLRPAWKDGSDSNGTAVKLSVSENPDSTLIEDIHYRRALELKLLGWQKEAGEELAQLTSKVGKERGVVLWVARLLNSSGEFHRALSLIQMFFSDVLDRGGPDIPSAFWEIAYPGGFLPFAKTLPLQGIDPHLVTAVIREESAYNPLAISTAGALGLMQVMPHTGQKIAAQVGSDGFSRERLFDPCYNIRFGSWYLGHLAEKFNHNLVYAIAAYNAGPDIVTKWIQQFGYREQDEFIESIPYTETRQYVKKVLRSYRQYGKIYGPESRTAFLDKGC